MQNRTVLVMVGIFLAAVNPFEVLNTYLVSFVRSSPNKQTAKMTAGAQFKFSIPLSKEFT
jgi:myosin heavy subunit